jgi:dipeptidyl aminopeptidase/acylaminoacyl peptidase
MIRRYRRLAATITIALTVAFSLPMPVLAADKRGITEMDLFKFVWIADPQISPDGSQVAFVRVWVNDKADRYDTALWIVSAGGGTARQLTVGPRDAAPRWSPDGKLLAFARSAEKDGRPQPPQIYLLPLEGGEARPVTEISKGVGGFEWSPDGATIAFINADEPKKEAPNPEAAEAKEKTPERVSDVRVITKAVYRANGPGYINPKVRSHIWTVSVPKQR